MWMTLSNYTVKGGGANEVGITFIGEYSLTLTL